MSDRNRQYWQRLMQVGLGVLHIPPEQFWKMTMAEFNAALEGYLASQGVDIQMLQGAVPPDLQEIMAMQQRFPDIVG